MLLLNVMLLLVGTVIDAIAALILVVPIMLPIAMLSYGIDPFHFGVAVCLNLVIGLLTPPVGTALYVTAQVSGCKPMSIMKPLAPFLLAALVILLLVSVWPALTLMLID
jgi:TRAP-type C4-dicarboxylate transport system permease large subunit